MAVRWLKRVALIYALCGVLYGARTIPLANSLTFREKLEAMAIVMVVWPIAVYYEFFPPPLPKLTLRT